MKHLLRYRGYKRKAQANLMVVLLIILATSLFISMIYVAYELTSWYESEKQKTSQLEVERLEENIIIEKIGQGIGSIHLNITNVGSVPVLIRYAIVVYVKGSELVMAYDELNVYINVGEELYNVKVDIPPPTNIKYIMLVTSRGRVFIKVIKTV